jgi:hypothetical protein|eukprot:COSAG06_NODE_1118_length_10635_cov_5.052946_2_plen_256_part_00
MAAVRPVLLLLAAAAPAATSASAAVARTETPPPSEPPALALQTRINASIASSEPHLAVAKAEYYFNSGSLTISHARDFTLDGTGSALWFSMGAGVLVHRCVNTTVVGFAIDYDPPVFFQATALADAAVSGKLLAVKMKTDAGFLTPHVFQRLYGHSTNGGGGDAADEFMQGPQWWAPSAPSAGRQGTDGSAGAATGDWQLTSQGFENFNATAMVGPLAGDGSFVYTQPAITPAPRKGDKLTAIVRQGFTVLVHNR